MAYRPPTGKLVPVIPSLQVIAQPGHTTGHCLRLGHQLAALTDNHVMPSNKLPAASKLQGTGCQAQPDEPAL